MLTRYIPLSSVCRYVAIPPNSEDAPVDWGQVHVPFRLWCPRLIVCQVLALLASLIAMFTRSHYFRSPPRLLLPIHLTCCRALFFSVFAHHHAAFTARSCSWIAVFASLSSLANARTSQSEGKSYMTTLLFACMSVISNYVMKDGNN